MAAASERSNIRNLREVVREVRLSEAERQDSVVELRETERARLAMLTEALAGAIDDLPPDQAQFVLQVVPTEPPRFWVDPTAFVMMGRDKRTYRFLKETRIGRTVLAEATRVGTIADAVIVYMAERIVEREQAIASDWVREKAFGEGRRARLDQGSRRSARIGAGLFWGVLGFGLGMIAGILVLFVYAWFAIT